MNSFVPSINPIYSGYRRDKHSSYESFRANERSDITTAALFAPEGVRDARAGETAAAVAEARAAVRREIQTSRAAAALFRGGPRSPGLSPGGGFETGERSRPRDETETPGSSGDAAMQSRTRGVDSSGEVGGRSRDRGERDRDEREASTRTICRSSSSVSSAILASRDEIRGFPGRARDEI